MSDEALPTIIPLGYRVKCTESGCRNLGRVILRHFDSGGCLWIMQSSVTRTRR
jgi:hypothetical protein